MDKDDCESCEEIPHWTYDLHYSDILRWWHLLIFFKGSELNLPPEIGLLNTCLLLTSFLMATPKTLLDGCVLFFFLTELESLCVLNAQRLKSSWCNYRKWPQGSSTSSCVTFFFFLNCNFLAIFYWNRINFWCSICFQCTEIKFNYICTFIFFMFFFA